MQSQRPKVLMVGPDVGAIGGMGSVAMTLADGCERSGRFDVQLLNSGGGNGRKGWRDWPAALRTAATAEADLVHLHVASQGSTWRKMSFAAVARRRGIPYVIHLHGAGYATFLAGLAPARKRLVAQFFQQAARIVTLGDSWRSIVMRELHTHPAKTLVVANGVDPVPVTAPGTTIVHLGELSRRKGVDVLLEAAAPVLADHAEWRLQLIGPAPDDELVNRARAMSDELGGRIEVVGPKFGDEKLPYLGGAGIFTLVSRQEGLPMAMLEAMSAGVPVVMTPVGAIGEVVTDGENGRLVQPGDVDGLAVVLRELVNDPQQRAGVGAAGQQTWREGYSSEAMVEGIERAWDAALGTAPSAQPLLTKAASVTVVIPTLGRGSLRAAVDSVLAQRNDLLDVRVVVVNDSAQLLDLAPTQGVAVIDTAGRTGSSGARNAGLAVVDTDFFAFLDDDDVQAEDHLATAIATLEAQEADVYFCRGLVHRGNGSSRVEPAELPGASTLREYLTGLSNWRSRSRRVLTPSVVVRGRWSDHRFDEAMTASEDTWYLLGLESRGARVVAGPGVHVTINGDQVRDDDRRTTQSDPDALQRRLADLDPTIVPGLLVGREGRVAVRAGDPAGVLRVASRARAAGGGRELVVPVAAEFAAAAGIALARRVRR